MRFITCKASGGDTNGIQRKRSMQCTFSDAETKITNHMQCHVPYD